MTPISSSTSEFSLSIPTLTHLHDPRSIPYPETRNWSRVRPGLPNPSADLTRGPDGNGTTDRCLGFVGLGLEDSGTGFSLPLRFR